MQYRFDEANHIHTLDGKPLMGTSTVVGVIAKPLTWWAAGLAIGELGWIKKLDPRKVDPEEVKLNEGKRKLGASLMLGQLKKMSGEEYLALLDKAYRAHADSLTKSADKGTDMHAALEEYVKWCISDNGGAPHEPQDSDALAVKIFCLWAIQNVRHSVLSKFLVKG